ncbi:MAG: winged helix-turn-helix domain-containing protein, partial [Prevotellaceae bacterium]|nr:winged helix-turn-helix domain-containing protein [Prevotellaceae bacterium]
MTLDEEAQILKSVEQQSLLGNILIYKDIKVIVEEKLGKSLSDDYIWDMFKRHGWRKKMPRQSYPKADKAAQEEYKKPQELLASQNDQNIRDYDVNAWTTVYLPLNITFVSDISYKTGSG